MLRQEHGGCESHRVRTKSPPGPVDCEPCYKLEFDFELAVKLSGCPVAAPVAGEQLVGAEEALAGGNPTIRCALGYILGSTRAAVSTAAAAAATVAPLLISNFTVELQFVESLIQ
jgi:hypothetical protein